jgi:nucleoside-diphosphate-sugar epimerase
VLFDEGRGLRDYTFVTDVVDALIRLSAVDDGHLVVNVGSDRPVLTSQVIDELERALGRAATRQLAPAQPGDVPATHADITRARDALGWSPRVPFAEGIDRFCAWLVAERSEGSDQPSAIDARPTPT